MTSCPPIAFLAGPLWVSSANIALLDLSTALSAQGVPVTILAGEGPLRDRFADASLDIRLFDLAGRLPADLPRLFEIARDLKAMPGAVLHVANQEMARAGAFVARLARRPFFLFVTDPERRPLPEGGGRLATRIVLCPAARDALVLSRGIPSAGVTLVPTWVDTNRYASSSTPLDREDVTLGTLADLDDAAGFADLLETERILLGEGHEVRLLIAGHGSREEPVRRASRRMGIQKHVTVSDLPRDFERVLDAVDIFVHPRVREWTGTSLAQAMAAGRPVVAAGTGAVFQLVTEGDDGLLAPLNDPRALAARVGELLADRDRARTMGTAARATVSGRFSVQNALTKLISMYTPLFEGAGT